MLLKNKLQYFLKYLKLYNYPFLNSRMLIFFKMIKKIQKQKFVYSLVVTLLYIFIFLSTIKYTLINII